MALLATVFKRALWAAILLLAVVVLNFLLLHAAPGDPADVIAGEMGGASPELLAEIRASYGLDQPLIVQLTTYVGRVAQGDLGNSFFFNRPVTGLILERLPATIALVLTSLLLAVFVGTLLGVLAARRPNGFLSHVVTIVALVGYALPVFWTGIMLIILFASILPWFPVSGMRDIVAGHTGWRWLLDVMHHMALPVITLSTIYLAFYSRLARASMLDVLGADYIRTARAKGLAEHAVIYRHALRNAVLPIVTFAGLQFGALLSGAVLVETVFSWPGLGTLAYDSILRRDSPTLLGILFFSAVLVIVANLLTDIAYGLVDPRIRKAGAR